MKNQKNSFLTLVFLTGAAMMVADFLILIFFGSSFSHLSLRLGIPAVIYLIIYCGILGHGAKNFDYTYFTKLEGDQYLQWLKQIGAVPLKRIILNVATHAVYLVIVFTGNYLGIEPSMKGPLFLALLSFGILVELLFMSCATGLFPVLCLPTILPSTLTTTGKSGRKQRL